MPERSTYERDSAGEYRNMLEGRMESAEIALREGLGNGIGEVSDVTYASAQSAPVAGEPIGLDAATAARFRRDHHRYHSFCLLLQRSRDQISEDRLKIAEILRKPIVL